jgi:membrane protease YdiL (CAAX protease family)
MRVRMEAHNFFVNKEGHLRSAWRITFFAIAFLVCAKVFEAVAGLAISALHIPAGGNADFLIGALILLSSATLVGWGCSVVFEGLSFRAVGWWPHRGWWKNLVLGSVIGAASLLLAAGLTAVTRGIRFSFDPSGTSSIGRTLIVSGAVFVLAGAGEEALFRGYPLQTLTRAKLAWLGVLLTSVPFAVVHLANPNATVAFTFLNTAVAGIWLAVAYLRTRSLWFPLGLHWAWNWTQASLLGLPVSGIKRIAPAPLLHAMNAGPDWLTGGAYGIEGGAACTLALVVSTLVVWRTKLVWQARDENLEMKSVVPAVAGESH